MMFPLSQIAAVAPQAGLPRDKTALIRRLQQAGAVPVEGRGPRGQMCKLYPADELPKEIMAHLSAAMGLTNGKAGNPEQWQRYYKAPQSQKDDADRRLTMVRRAAELVESGATKAGAFRHVAAENGVSPAKVKSAWRIVQDFDPTDWLPALVKNYTGRQAEPLHPEIERYFFGDYGRVEQPQVQAVHDRTCAAAAKNGWGQVPSARTLKRRWDRLPAPVKAYWRQGDKALADCFPYAQRDRSGMKPLDSVCVDGRTWDLWVNDSGGAMLADVSGFEDTPPEPRSRRLTIAMAVDEATNTLLAYAIGQSESSDLYRRLLCQVFTEHGLPNMIRFDNTRAAANKALTAGAKTRFRFTERPDDVPGILTRLGVTVRFTMPFNGRAKVVERTFADVKERAEKHPALAGAYAGRSPAEKPANYRERPVELSTFIRCLDEAVGHYNTRTDRRGLVAFKTSYRALFEQGLAAAPPRRLSEAQRQYFFCIGTRCLVSPAGEVYLGKRPFRNRFWSTALQSYAGQRIIVRYDPDNLKAPIMAETDDGRLIDDAVPCIEGIGFDNRDQAREHLRERRRSVRHTKEAAKAIERMNAIELCAALPEPAPPATTSLNVVSMSPHLTTPKPAETTSLDAESMEQAVKYLQWSSEGGFAVNE
jgi:hypothetical protein